MKSAAPLSWRVFSSSTIISRGVASIFLFLVLVPTLYGTDESSSQYPLRPSGMSWADHVPSRRNGFPSSSKEFFLSNESTPFLTLSTPAYPTTKGTVGVPADVFRTIVLSPGVISANICGWHIEQSSLYYAKSGVNFFGERAKSTKDGFDTDTPAPRDS